MARETLFSVGVAALLLGAGCGGEPSAAPAAKTTESETAVSETAKPQTTCPVMGGAIDKSIYADHDGKRVYFCCRMCVAEFRKDPEKQIKKLEDQGVVLEKTPPTTGR